MKHARGAAGQALLIAVFIALLLFICVPVVIFMSRSGGSSQMESYKRAKSRVGAEEGMAYATQILSASGNIWNLALQTTPPPDFPNECELGAPAIESPSGKRFRLLCSHDAPQGLARQPYQVNVVASAMEWGAENTLLPYRSLEGLLSKRTLGADLTTGLHVAAALQLVKLPKIDGDLEVHWGPIVCLDDVGVFKLRGPLDVVDVGAGVMRPGFPRKITQGGITGSFFDPDPSAGGAPLFPRAPNQINDATTTDQREYWAFASQKVPPGIDLAAYRDRAALGAPVPVPTGASPVGGGVLRVNVTAETGAGGLAVITNSTFATVADDSTVIYIEGASDAVVRIENLALNLSRGALIIAGPNVELGTRTMGLGPTAVRFPPDAVREYSADYTAWPCQVNGNAAGTCAGITPNFIGFFWATNNVQVKDDNEWVFSGAMLVGNAQADSSTAQLIIDPSAKLTLYYDDIINHAILTAPIRGNAIEIQPTCCVRFPRDNREQIT